MEGGQFGRTELFFSCEKGERVDVERLAKSEDLEIFGSPDGHLFELFCKIFNIIVQYTAQQILSFL